MLNCTKNSDCFLKAEINEVNFLSISMTKSINPTSWICTFRIRADNRYDTKRLSILQFSFLFDSGAADFSDFPKTINKSNADGRRESITLMMPKQSVVLKVMLPKQFKHPFQKSQEVCYSPCCI